MPRQVDLGILGEADGPERCLTIDDDAKVRTLRTLISEATGVAPERLKLVALKGRAMTSLGEGERVPRVVKVGGAPSLDAIGVEKKSNPVDEPKPVNDPPPPVATPALRAPPPPREPREPRDPRPAVPAKPKSVSKEEAAAKAAARKAKMDAKATGYPSATVATAVATQNAPKPPPARLAQKHPEFTLGMALDLQEEMKVAFSDGTFQDKLGQMVLETEALQITERHKRYRDLLLTVQKKVLPKFGFEGSPKGVQMMLTVFQDNGFNDDPTVDANTTTLNMLLSMDIAGQTYAAKMAEQQKLQAMRTSVLKPWEEVPWEVINVKPEPPKPAPIVEPVQAAAPQAQPQQLPQPADLLSAYIAAGWKPPSKEELIAMQVDLIAGYKLPEFQKKLRELPLGQTGWVAKQDLLWSVQGPVIAKYGFPESSEGLNLSGQVFTRELNKDPVIAKNNEELFLWLDPQMQERRAKMAAAATAKAGAGTEAKAPPPKAEAPKVKRLELTLQGSKDKPTTLEVEGDPPVESVRKLVAEATCMDPQAVSLLWKPAGSAPPVVLQDKAKCPPKVVVRGPSSLAPGGALLTRALSVQFQRELAERYSAEGFRRRMLALARLPQAQRRNSLRELCLEEQRQVLPRYGFQGSRDGVLVMLLAFNLVQKDMQARGDEEMINTAAQLNQLLDLDAIAAEGAVADEQAAAPAGDVGVPAPAAPVPAAPAPAPPASKQPPAMAAAWMSAMMLQEDFEEEDNTDEEAADAIWNAPPPAKAPPAAPPTKAAAAKSPAISLAPRWTVVGGAANGILVRRTADLHSPELGRLRMGAILKEKKMDGDRLHYDKESGDGPDSGWISLTFKGSDLVRRL